MSITKFEDVKHITTEEYFNGNQFSIDAFNKKYAQKISSSEIETYPKALKRVCDFIASAEKDEFTQKYWAERWFDEIWNDWWSPAGSIMQGAGSSKSISLANCTTISLGVGDDQNEWDNLESIVKNTAYTVAKTAAFRQGLGVDFSRLRPKGVPVNNSSNESQGVIHWMKFIDSIGNYIGQKGRIPAMLFSISVNHPDVEEFVQVKSDLNSIQNANISVQTNNAFYKAVEDDADWVMEFLVPARKAGDKVYVDIHSVDMECQKDENGKFFKIAKKDRQEEKITKTTKARKLLELIAKNMHQFAEPGIQQIDMARYWSNSDYVYNPNDFYDSRIVSTNACSEQYLSRESLCVLASINVGNFSTDKFEYNVELKKIGYSINRFLDNVNEMELKSNTYATPHQKIAIEKLRRTGAGVTNMVAWLFRQNLEYGTQEANDAICEFNKTYNFYLYESSISLGQEKGSFGLFNRDQYEQSPFIQNMMKLGLEFKTMRNVTCSSIAPVGTLSLMFKDFIMSYGVEPGFGIYFWKRTRISGKYEYYFCVPNAVRKVFAERGRPIPMSADTIKDSWDGELGKPIAKFIDENKDAIGVKFNNATQVNVMDKLDLMSKLMKYVDSSISVTYNLHEDSKWEDTYNLIIEANKRGVKSIAAFPDRKMYGIVSYVSFKDLALQLKAANIHMFPSNFTDSEKRELDIFDKSTSSTNNASKRQKELEADIYVVTVKGAKYIMAVGLQDGRPYEIFGGLVNDNMVFKFTHKKGKIIKVKQSFYTIEIGEDIVIKNFGEYFTSVEQTLFRMISTSLRHNIPIRFIVEQLNKSSEDMSSLASATSRVLKKYIRNGETASGKCPQCSGNNLVYSGGCANCSSCGWEKCS